MATESQSSCRQAGKHSSMYGSSFLKTRLRTQLCSGCLSHKNFFSSSKINFEAMNPLDVCMGSLDSTKEHTNTSAYTGKNNREQDLKCVLFGVDRCFKDVLKATSRRPCCTNAVPGQCCVLGHYYSNVLTGHCCETMSSDTPLI